MAEPDSALTDPKAQRIAVAVELDTQQLLRIAGGFALHPDRVARARPIDPAPLADGTDQRLSGAPHQSQRLSQLVADDGGPDAAVERSYIIRCGNSTSRCDACRAGRRDDAANGLQVESVHRAFVLDLGEEKPTDVGRERRDAFSDVCAGVRAPPVDYDVAMLRVDCSDHAVA